MKAMEAIVKMIEFIDRRGVAMLSSEELEGISRVVRKPPEWRWRGRSRERTVDGMHCNRKHPKAG